MLIPGEADLAVIPMPGKGNRMVKKDIPQRRATDGNGRWDAVVKALQIASVVMLAWIGYLTKVSGDKANIAAAEAQKAATVVAQVAAQQDTTLGTIHGLVDSTNDRLDLLVEAQNYNAVLRDQLKRAGIKPAPPR